MLETAQYAHLPIPDFIERLSGSDPTPGGGSASALVGLIACSLSQMVARIVSKKIVEMPQSKKLQTLLDSLETEKQGMMKVIDEDPKVFLHLMNTYRIPKEAEDRARKIDGALVQAAGCQQELALALIRLKGINRELKGLAEGSIGNDLLLSQAFTEAAFQGAFLTAQINWVYIKDAATKQKLSEELQSLKNQFSEK